MKIVFLGFKAGFFGSLVCAGIAAGRLVYFLLSGNYELAELELVAVVVFALLSWCFRNQLQKMV